MDLRVKAQSGPAASALLEPGVSREGTLQSWALSGSTRGPHCSVVTLGMAGVSPFPSRPSDDSDTWTGISPGGKTGEEHALPIAKQPEN